MPQPPTPPGLPGQPLPQPQPQRWPQQGMQRSTDRGVDPDGPATDAASTPTDGSAAAVAAAEGIPGWTPPPWTAGADAPAGWSPPPWTAGPDAFWRIQPAPWGAPAEKARLVGWAEWAASTTFSSSGLMSGYDKREVNAFRSAVRDTFLGVRKPPVRSDDVRPREWFSTHWRDYDKTYDKTQVDVFLEVASIRLAAMESTDAVKVTVVYESMFGNTRKVAQAISDGVREAYPVAHVECVAVGRASAELIKSTDLLIVGEPTHLCRMTTDFSRKRQISREKKAEAKGGPPRELEPDAEGLGLREWFYQVPRAKKWGHAAAFDTTLGSALAGGAGYGIARKLRGHGYELVRNPEAFILDDAYGPLHTGEIERAKKWGAQVVRASVANPEGWAIWNRLVISNE